MPEVRLITITEPELESLIDRVCRKAILDAFAQTIHSNALNPK